MPLINFPNVPNVLGVPNVARSGLSIDQDAIMSAIYSGDILSILDSVITPKWGIYAQDGSQVILPDSVLDIEYKGESRILDYPIEAGGFASFNKVATPFDIRMKMACSGNLSAARMTRESFLARLDEMQASLDLYNIVTPDYVYNNVDLVGYDYRRTNENGVTLLIVEARFNEVRVTGDAQYKSVKSDSAANPVNQGQVYANKPTAEQFSAAPQTAEEIF
ncbi:phage baseplate protein [Yersinia sp. 2545 StPb PI]|uniref:phage baseplate protein n=1 Tax=Yersinia sp. 2545 StPb PI TaxID=3117410 RepID=UPI003FA41E50